MSHLDQPRPVGRKELRKFAFLVGGAFTVLASVALWRHRSPVLIRTFGGLGIALLVVGALAPMALSRVYAAWMRMAMLISKVTTPILMSVIYFVVLTPTSWIMRVFGWRPLTSKAKALGWVTRPEGARASNLERQF